MIPSDREIKLALRRDLLRITPLPSDKAISSTSVDLTLHEEISFWLPQPQELAEPVVVYPARSTFDVVPLLREHGTTPRRQPPSGPSPYQAGPALPTGVTTGCPTAPKATIARSVSPPTPAPPGRRRLQET